MQNLRASLRHSLVASALLVAAVALAAPAHASAADTDNRPWVQLFDGKSLDGWTPKIRGFEAGVNFADTFRVQDGLLKVRYDKYDRFGGRFGHLFYRQRFSHYIVAVEYRFVGQQATDGPEWAFKNSGIMIHGQTPESMPKEQDFPISIEVQLLGGRSVGDRPTANLCTPGTNVVMKGRLETEHCTNSTSPTFRGEEWVRVEVEVHGDAVIQHRVNGETVLTYEMPQVGGGVVSGYDPAVFHDGLLLTEGTISLQSESHPIDFRKVEILDLTGCVDPKATNYRSHAVKSVPSSCTYR